jgi:hypothetical protein
MQFVKEEVPILISSNTELGALNKSANGSAFKVRLEDGLAIPKNAVNVNLRVESASVWYTTPNIITGVNDTLSITGPDKNDVLTNFNIVIEQGLYSVDNLTYAIEVGLQQTGAKYLDNQGVRKPLIEFTPQTATGKLLLDINYDNVTVDFSASRNFGEILGWINQVVGPFPGQEMPVILVPSNVAKFNQIDYYLINSSIIDQGLRVNSRYNHTIARVLIDVEPGSQIIYSPNHPTRCNANSLRGVRKTELEFWLTDQNYRRVDTQGENWSANIVIEYYLPINDQSFR